MGLVIVKMLIKKAQNTLIFKIKVVRNSATLDVTNGSFEAVYLLPRKC